MLMGIMIMNVNVDSFVHSIVVAHDSVINFIIIVTTTTTTTTVRQGSQWSDIF